MREKLDERYLRTSVPSLQLPVNLYFKMKSYKKIFFKDRIARRGVTVKNWKEDRVEDIS